MPTSGTYPLPPYRRRKISRHYRRVLLSLVLLISGGPVWRRASAGTAEDQKALADALFARGFYEMAVAEYSNLLQRTDLPEREAVLFRLAEALRRSGRIEEALSYYEKCIGAGAASNLLIQALTQQGWCELQSGRTEQALTHLRQAIELGGGPIEAATARFYAALAEEQAGNPKHCEALLREILNRYRETPVAPLAALRLDELIASGSLTGDRGELLDFVLHSTNATREATAEALLRYGELAFNQGRYRPSIARLEELRRQFPDTEQAHLARLPLAWANFHAGQYKEALQLAEIALSQETNEAAVSEWLYLKANAQREMSDQESAAATYRSLLKRFPQSQFSEAARVELAQILVDGNRFAEAYELLSACEPAGKPADQALWLLARSARMIGRTNEALRACERLLQNHPDSPLGAQAAFHQAELTRMLGHAEQAAKLFQAVAEKYPAEDIAAPALWNAAMAWVEAGDEARAVEAYAELTRRFPESDFASRSLYRKGLIHVRRQEWEKARKTLNRLLEQAPQFSRRAEALYWLAVAAENCGDTAEAESAYRRLLEVQPAAPLSLRCNARLKLATLLRKREAREEAAAVLRMLLQENCSDAAAAEAYLWLAHYEFEAGNWSNTWQAASRLMKVTSKPEERQKAAFYAGVALSRLHRYDEAVTNLLQALKPEESLPQAAYAALELGDAELARRNPKAAEQAYRRAAEIASRHSNADVQLKAWYALARLEEMQGNEDEALRLYTGCGILFDDPAIVPECMFRAVSLLQQQGREEEAGKLAAELRQRYPGSRWARRLGERGSEGSTRGEQ